MSNEKANVNCPNCGTSIDVNELVYHQLQKDAKQQYESKLAEEKEKFQAKVSEINNEKEALKKMKLELEESIEKGVSSKLLTEKVKLEKKIRDQIVEEKSQE